MVCGEGKTSKDCKNTNNNYHNGAPAELLSPVVPWLAARQITFVLTSVHLREEVSYHSSLMSLTFVIHGS